MELCDSDSENILTSIPLLLNIYDRVEHVLKRMHPRKMPEWGERVKVILLGWVRQKQSAIKKEKEKNAMLLKLGSDI